MSKRALDDVLKGKAPLAVIGLGYVGLPIALEFAAEIPVIGFDICSKNIDHLRQGKDPSQEIAGEAFIGKNIHFTGDPQELAQARIYIVAVPTPIDNSKLPDLSALRSASAMVGAALREGDLVIYESTVYPGATEEECIPLLEEHSGLKAGSQFKVGYSPERINPGDKVHVLRTIVKVVSGMDQETLDAVANLYERIVDAGVHRASSIKVAEAAKIIENTQRDVNIALMNELSIIFNRMGINTFEVLEAAGTKWNFLKFYPGLVGGHCIGVDPYYLTYKAKQLRYHAQVITSGRFVNDSMGYYTAKQLVKKLIAAGKNVLDSRVLIMGVTFKEDVSDIRNSRVPDIYSELLSYGVSVDVSDPHASPEEVLKEYGIRLTNGSGHDYDAIVVAVAHKEYHTLTEADFLKKCRPRPVLVDVKGIFRDRIGEMTYWSL
jgi:UDP-N-acetyl-D-galactosamine dehydrogenase